AAEEVGVVDPIGAQCGSERIGHLRLPNELGEGLGPVAAIEGGNHGLNRSRGRRQRAPGGVSQSRAGHRQDRGGPLFASILVTGRQPIYGNMAPRRENATVGSANRQKSEVALVQSNSSKASRFLH